MLYKNTPIGKIQVPEWEQKGIMVLSDVELIQKAIIENKNFVISPAVFAMIEKRGLLPRLQHCIDPHMGLSGGEKTESLIGM